MGKSGIQRQEADRTIFVAEVIMDSHRSPQWVDLVLSIAGRESTFTRRWQVFGGRLDTAALSDMAAVASQSITDAVMMMLGVQEVLPLS